MCIQEIISSVIALIALGALVWSIWSARKSSRLTERALDLTRRSSDFDTMALIIKELDSDIAAADRNYVYILDKSNKGWDDNLQVIKDRIGEQNYLQSQM